MLTAIIAGLIHERTGCRRACRRFRRQKRRVPSAVPPPWAAVHHHLGGDEQVARDDGFGNLDCGIPRRSSRTRRISRTYSAHTNICPTCGRWAYARCGAIFAVDDVGWKDRGKLGLNLYPKQGQKENPSTNWSFPVRRVDDLFSSEQLGLLHLDVEFHELEVLRGAEAVIARDQPVITTEVMVHSLRNETVEGPLRWLKARGYDSFLIDEICGMRADFRNLLHLPRTRSFLGSSTLDLAVAARALVAVDGNTIRNYAFPCCEPGGGCCPLSRGRPAGSCCAHWRVHAWLVEQAKAGAIDLSLAFATPHSLDWKTTTRRRGASRRTRTSRLPAADAGARSAARRLVERERQGPHAPARRRRLLVLRGRVREGGRLSSSRT